MGNNNQKPRAHALDALRGYAIITMVLSAMEAFSVLPRWMYHAQVPPPDHVFDPTIYGITWVDIIFPFFLFSMGAAIPLSLGRQHAKGESIMKLTWKTVQRWVKLTFFAIFIIHAFPFMLGYEQEWMRYAMPIFFFILLCLMFMPNPFGLSPYKARAITWSAYLVAVGFMLLQPYAGGAPFRLTDSDCIMLILANVSLTGSIIYLLTIGHPLRRLALLPFLVALFMAAHTANSWPALLIHTSWLPWLYLPAYQEYLLIIIPGTVAGEWIAQWLEKMKTNDTSKGLVDNYQKKNEAVLESGNPLKGGRGAVLENGNKVKNDEKAVLEKGNPLKGGREAVLENVNKVKNDEKAVLENENKVRTRSEEMKDKENALALLVALLSLALIVVNVVLLFGRHLVANLVATMVLTALTAWLLRSRREAGTTDVEAAKQRAASKDASSQEAAKQEVSNREASSQEAAKQEVYNQKSSSAPVSPTLHFWQRLSSAGAYLLLLGLCLESYEGGIRKDDVTLSYLFVTCGLAFYALLLLTVVCDHWHVRWLCAPLEMVGKNPMVAYVSASMVIIPVLILTQLYPYIDALSSQPLTGFLKGVLLTALCMALTAWFTHKRWFWKT
jgi:predicted acyltransferase/Sec-independent protein translocase protein TatA